jgi:hypothetical protein
MENLCLSRLAGPTIDSLGWNPSATVIECGARGGFDECGAWLQAIGTTPGVVHGYYHAETRCNYGINQTHKSVAYAESYDGGRTFAKVGYPDNQIVTGTTRRPMERLRTLETLQWCSGATTCGCLTSTGTAFYLFHMYIPGSWVTTAALPDDYRPEFTVGSVFTRDYGGLTPLLDCYIPEWNDHMIGVGTCGDGVQRLRLLGWIYPASAPQPPGTVPLYRCFFPGWTDHWVSNTECNGGDPSNPTQTEFVIGYAAQ